ncbi:ATP-binding protein [Streptomyces sp. NPDC050560]|uniref:ATP-binding protein n=1 Tax=Streptomyces sp. NPDC050560 TaxID=3365630 RepID=UPI003797BDE9
MTQSPPPTSAQGPLWERDDALAAAGHAIDALRAGAGPGTLIVFRGEAGIGKTALLGEVRRVAGPRCTVCTARGGETLASVPFHVVRQLFGPLLMAMPEQERAACFGDHFEITAPALGLAEPGERQADPGGVTDGLAAVTGRIARRGRPLVLLVDDAQWADLETVQWLDALTRDIAALPVLLVVAHRPGDAVAADTGFLAERAADVPGSTLRALTPAAVTGLTRATLGADADAAFCREVAEVTRGNPYETVELLAKVRDTATPPLARHAPALGALARSSRGGGLVARLEELGPEATQFARIAAIVGTRVPLPLAARMCGFDEDTARDCAARLGAARILALDAEDGCDFVHPLIADAVYGSVSEATRTALHGLVADTLLGDGHSAAAVSSHLLRLHPDEDPETVDVLRRAAREHLAVGAPAAARRCLERALREPPTPDVHALVEYELGCATLLTSPDATIHHLRTALALPGGLTPDIRVDAVCRLSQALVHNDDVREAVREVDAEAGRLPPGPARLRLQAMHYLWEGMHAAGEDPKGRYRSLEALAAPLPGRDNPERALLILYAFEALNRGERAELVVELCDRALVDGRLAPGMGWTDTEWSFELLVMLGSCYLFCDRLARADALFTEALGTYERAGWSGGHLAVAHAFVGYVRRRSGRLAEAERWLRDALRLADRVGQRLPMHWDAACMLIETLLARGRVDEARRIADRYGFGSPYPAILVLPDARSVRGRLLIAAGHTKEGVDELEAAEHAARVRGSHNTVMAPWAGELARAVAADDPLRAAALAERATIDADRFGTDTAVGEALRGRARLATGPAALALHKAAVARLEASPCRYEHARALVDLGAAARDGSALRRGLELATRCAADGLAHRAARLLDETA